MAESNHHLADLMGVTADDLNIRTYSEGEQLYQGVLNKALQSEALQKLVTKLESLGIKSDKEDTTVRTVTIDILKENPEENPTGTQVLFPSYQNGEPVGGIIYTKTSEGENVFSVTQKGNTDAHDIFYYENNKVEHMVVVDGQIIESTAEIETLEQPSVGTLQFDCSSLCSSICGTGFGSQIGGCIRQCRVAGPGYWWCLGLCSVVVGVGCAFGCDRICGIFGQ